MAYSPLAVTFGMLVVFLVCLIPLRVGITFFITLHKWNVRIVFGLKRPFHIRLPVPWTPVVVLASRITRSSRVVDDGLGRKAARNIVRLMRDIGRFFFTTIRSVETFQWHTSIGSGDAAVTSYIGGALWALKASVVGLLFHRYDFQERPTYSVTPNFDAVDFKARGCCIFRFTIGDIIVAIVMRLFPYVKEGRTFESKRSSY